MREKKITVAAIVIVMLLLVGYLFVYQVRVDEVAVHYRPPGNVLKIRNAGGQDESGLYLRLPWPVDRIVKYDRSVRVLEGKTPETQLQDNWQVIISMYAGWRIENPVEFEQKLGGSIKQAEESLSQTMLSETSKVVGRRTFRDLVNTKKDEIKFAEIEKEIADKVQAAVKSQGYGIQVCALGIRRIAMPESTTQKVFDRMIAERMTIAQGFRSEGLAQSEKIIAEAKREAAKKRDDADAESRQIRAQGEEAESVFYQQFAKLPELAIFLRQLEALRTIAEQARQADTPITIVLDTKTPPWSIMSEGAEQQAPKIAVEPPVSLGADSKALLNPPKK